VSAVYQKEKAPISITPMEAGNFETLTKVPEKIGLLCLRSLERIKMRLKIVFEIQDASAEVKRR
jgi:hypothetical protein